MRFALAFVVTSLIAASGHIALGASTGTGFIINPEGFILTNNHVVIERVKDKDGQVWERTCERLGVKGEGIRARARIIGRDQVNDLAVIKIKTDGSTRSVSRAADRRLTGAVANRPTQSGPRSLGDELADRGREPPVSQALAHAEPVNFSSGALRFAARSVRPGQPIRLYGFPFGEMVSSQLKVTSGAVVSTMGIGNNSSVIQIDAATNPGNSGGPVLNASGNVVAIVSSLLEGTQGFNFAVNATVAKQFLDSMGVAYATDPSGTPSTTEEQYSRVRPFVVLVICF